MADVELINALTGAQWEELFSSNRVFLGENLIPNRFLLDHVIDRVSRWPPRMLVEFMQSLYCENRHVYERLIENLKRPLDEEISRMMAIELTPEPPEHETAAGLDGMNALTRPQWKELFRKNRAFLVENLKPGKVLLDILAQHNLISDILSEKCRLECRIRHRARMLLDHVSRRPAETIVKFMQILHRENRRVYEHLHNKIRNPMMESEASIETNPTVQLLMSLWRRRIPTPIFMGDMSEAGGDTEPSAFGLLVAAPEPTPAATSGAPGGKYIDERCELVNDEVGEPECIVCLTNRKKIVCIPCGHMKMCKECAIKIMSKTRKCPMCRFSVEKILPVFD